MSNSADDSLSIGEVSLRTGLSIATLRAWEARHGFPRPERLAGGHRRYTVDDADAVTRVINLRSSGSTMADALSRREVVVRSPTHSLFAELRTISPRLPTTPMRASTLLALSHATEDEYLARAQPGFVFGGFQTERNFDLARSRWLELARVARGALAFADFAAPTTHAPPPALAEIALAPDSPMRREWALVCDAPGLSVALIGWEVPGSAGPTDPDDRAFETIWTLDPEAVRHVSRLCVTVAASAGYAGAARLMAELAPPAPAVPEIPPGAVRLMNRFITYLEDGSSAHAPEPPKGPGASVLTPT